VRPLTTQFWIFNAQLLSFLLSHIIQNGRALKIQQNGGHFVQFVSETEILFIWQIFSSRYISNNLNPTVETSPEENCIKNNTIYEELDDLIFFFYRKWTSMLSLFPMYMLPRSKNKSYPSYKNKLLNYLQKIKFWNKEACHTIYYVNFYNIWNRPQIPEKHKGLSHAMLGNVKELMNYSHNYLKYHNNGLKL